MEVINLNGSFKFSPEEEEILLSAENILNNLEDKIPENAFIIDKGTGEIHHATEIASAKYLLDALSWNGKTYFSSEKEGFRFCCEEDSP